MEIPVDKLFIEQIFANNCGKLYSCRWSDKDQNEIVPQLRRFLRSRKFIIQTLHALIIIGPRASRALPEVSAFIHHPDPVIRRMSIGTIGRFAPEEPAKCLPLIIEALPDKECTLTCLQIVAALGCAASAYEKIIQPYFECKNAKFRKQAVMFLHKLDRPDSLSRLILERASVRKIVEKKATS